MLCCAAPRQTERAPKEPASAQPPRAERQRDKPTHDRAADRDRPSKGSDPVRAYQREHAPSGRWAPSGHADRWRDRGNDRDQHGERGGDRGAGSGAGAGGWFPDKGGRSPISRPAVPLVAAEAKPTAQSDTRARLKIVVSAAHMKSIQWKKVKENIAERQSSPRGPPVWALVSALHRTTYRTHTTAYNTASIQHTALGRTLFIRPQRSTSDSQREPLGPPPSACQASAKCALFPLATLWPQSLCYRMVNRGMQPWLRCSYTEQTKLVAAAHELEDEISGSGLPLDYSPVLTQPARPPAHSLRSGYSMRTGGALHSAHGMASPQFH